MLRDAALNWVRSNLPDPRFRQEFESHYDMAAQQGRNCFVAIGPGLTRNQRPQLLHCFCGDLFVFELTPAQTRGYNLGHAEVMWGTGRIMEQPRLIEPIPVTISELQIERADDLPMDQPILATVSFDTNGLYIGPCVFRLDYEVPGLQSSVGWHYVDHALGTSGKIQCRFMAVKKPDADIKADGPVVMFLRLCSLPDPKVVENRLPISNTAAALVTLT